MRRRGCALGAATLIIVGVLTLVGIAGAGAGSALSMWPPAVPDAVQTALVDANVLPSATALPTATVPAKPTARPAAPAPTPPRAAAKPTARPAPTAAKPAATPVPTVTAAVVATVAAPTIPDLIVVASERGQSVTLIDAVTSQVTRTIPLGVPVVDMAVHPDRVTLWAFSNNAGEMDYRVVDLATGDRRGERRLGYGPRAAVFSSDGQRAYVALPGTTEFPVPANSVVWLNAASGDPIGRTELGRQTNGVGLRRRPIALAISPTASGEVLYVAGNGSGTVWALDATGQQLAELEVGGGPRVLLSDVRRQRVYAVLDTVNAIAVIDTSTRTIEAQFALPGRPGGAALGQDGTIYVAGAAAGELWAISPSDGKVTSRIPVGHEPAGVALGSDGSRLYVANRGDDTLSIVDLATYQVVDTIAAGPDPGALVVVEHPTPGALAAANLAPAVPLPPAPLAPLETPTPAGAPAAFEAAAPQEHLLPGVISEPFVPGAEFPVSMVFTPDGRTFYSEYRTGRIRVVDKGKLLPTPFYQFGVSDQPEAGLLGLTLDPAFEKNHYVYVFYTEVAGGGPQSGGPNGPNQLVRLTDANSRGTALTSILKDIPSGPIHNAGTLHFGPDGKLFVSVGDNQAGSSAQDLTTLAGKILRINPDGSIPPDNPFVGQPGKLGQIWAYGLRNPYGFDFHPITHQIFATENGPGDNDELNVIVPGGNYGWPPSGFQYRPDMVDPIAVFNPTIGPTGLTFNTGNQFPGWKNDLFYCNYHQGQLRRIRLAPGSYDRVVSEEIVKVGCTTGVWLGSDGALYYGDVHAINRIRQSSMPGLPAVTTSEAPLGPTPTPLPAGTREQDRDVDVSLREWSVGPSRGRVPAGTIRLNAENVGATVHSLRVVGPGVDVTTEQFGPGQSRSLELELAPGDYRLTCPIGGHTELGMVADFTVVGS
jgi:YVTN family beta-propeller protein